MSEEESSNVNDTIDAVTGLVKEIPIYEDAIQPVAKEAGKTLQTIGKAVNAAFLPIRGLVWGAGKFEDFVKSKVEKKLENTPIDNICSPNLSVAGPAFESLKYVGHEEALREMYANLIANAMDTSTKDDAHPSFVEIIKQLSSQEARLLLFLSQRNVFPEVCSLITRNTISNDFFDPIDSENILGQVKSEFLIICSKYIENMDFESALDNYRRLQLLDIETNTTQSIRENSFSTFSFSDESPFNDKIELTIKTTEELFFTKFGQNFIKICVTDK